MVVLDDVDLSQEFGHQIGGMRSAQVVSDESLRIVFRRNIQAPLINAIEIIAIEQEPRVELIGVVPDTFTTNGGTFDLSIIPRDAEGNVIVGEVTSDKFSFRDISVSFDATPEDVATGGTAQVTEIEIIESEAGENVSLILDFNSSGIDFQEMFRETFMPL